jgi:hypothetical protein
MAFRQVSCKVIFESKEKTPVPDFGMMTRRMEALVFVVNNRFWDSVHAYQMGIELFFSLDKLLVVSSDFACPTIEEARVSSLVVLHHMILLLLLSPKYVLPAIRVKADMPFFVMPLVVWFTPEGLTANATFIHRILDLLR